MGDGHTGWMGAMGGWWIVGAAVIAVAVWAVFRMRARR